MSADDGSWATGAFRSCPVQRAAEAELYRLRRTLEEPHLVSQEAVLRARLTELEERQALDRRLRIGNLDAAEEAGIEWRIAEIDAGRALDRELG